MDLTSRIEALEALFDKSGFWLVENTILAWIPVVLALLVFRAWDDDSGPDRRSPLWWFGLVLFVLFLPNAPYVVTDLVHLRGDIQHLGPDGPAATTILPVYALFIASGFAAYYLALLILGRYLDRVGLDRYRGQLLLGLHALVAVGIFLGRWSRLNSWEPVVSPGATAERIFEAFASSSAPVLIFTLFLVTAIGHFVTKAVLEAAWAWLRSALVRRGFVGEHVT